MTLLSVENLTIALPPGADRPNAVQNLSFTLDPSEILCIVGESGSGKSVAASAIMGLLPKSLRPTTGTITFESKDLLKTPEYKMRALRGARLGMIFQEPMTALNPLMRIGDQITEILQVHKIPPKNRVQDLLEAVHLPDPARIVRAYPHRLSGGQRQRVMIAMALALEPAILIADEPTTALDVTTQMQILRLIREIQHRRGTGILFITHDFGVVAEIADRVAVMQRGEIVEQGPAAHLLANPSHPYTKALLAAVPRGASTPRPPVDGPPILTLTNVRKTYGNGWIRRTALPAIADASLQIHRGETLGLVGESGSGKSTLARCIVNLVHADAGEITFDDQNLRTLSRTAWLPYRGRIQMVFQDPYASLNPRRRVADIIMEGPLARGTARPAARARATELLRLVQLDPAAADRFPHEFSGGQRQRIGIARALAMNPELLIADEPVSALDVSVQAEILALLEDLRARLGLTMLFITHDLRVAAQVCDRVAVMQRGHIVEQGPTAQVFTTPTHPYTKTLLDSIPGHTLTRQLTEDHPLFRRSTATLNRPDPEPAPSSSADRD